MYLVSPALIYGKILLKYIPLLQVYYSIFLHSPFFNLEAILGIYAMISKSGTIIKIFHEKRNAG
jgi:hypothetical protein